MFSIVLLVITPQTKQLSGILFNGDFLNLKTSKHFALDTISAQDSLPRYYSPTDLHPNQSIQLINNHYKPSSISLQAGIQGVQLGDGEIFPESEFIDNNFEIPLNGNGVTTFDVWYGSSQDFGQIGNPQKWVNILGNVSDTDGITSLSYTLNGGPQQALSIGPDGRRLASPGDFNIDIDQADLVNGGNQVVITAVDGLNNQSNTTVTVNYTAGNTWPLPYSIDWSATTDIQQVAQVVDGEWSIQPDGLRIDNPGYDRLVAIGDVTWTDYEVLFPITIHNVDYPGAGLGVLMRWQGHTDDPVTCTQPKCGWIPNGNIGWWIFASPTDVRLQWFHPAINQTFFPALETEYMFRARVESTPGEGGLYSLKVWEADQVEPVEWNLVIQESANDITSGSFMLLAHNVDATFGDVTVTPYPIPSYSLSISMAGNGSVTRDPDQDTYSYNDIVALEAFPAIGWSFANWSGDINGSENPTTVTIVDDMSVTANFDQEDYLLTIDKVGNGTVTKDPDQSTYHYNDEVTLTADPDPGWSFAGWSGEVSSSDNPLDVTIQDNTAITATFTQDQYSLTINTNGNGAVDIDPDQTTYVYGELVTLTAVADAGWSFAAWNGDAAGSDNPLEYTLQGDTTITATFTQDQYSLSFNTVGSGSVDIDPDQTTYVYGDVVTMTAVADASWSFAAWSGDASGDDNPLEHTIMGDTTITATFAQDVYTLTVNTFGNGSIDINPEKTFYIYNEIVTLTATSAPGWNFAGWSGDVTSSDNPLDIVIQDNTTITATFTQDAYTLTVNTIGSGSVDIAPDLNTYVYGDVVTMTAVADASWSFAAWSGDVSSSNNPLDITIQDDTSITATFTQDEYSLTVNTVGNGSVGTDPDKFTYIYNEVVNLTAMSAPGWTFAGWSGDGSGSVNPLDVTIQDNTNITATFTQDTYTLALNILGSGSVDIDPEKEIYQYGDTVTLTPTPASNWFFEGWYGDQSGNENPLILLIERDTYIIATFDQELNFFPLISR